jgi:hypothetical protein
LIGGIEPGQTWVRHRLHVSLVVDNKDLLAPPIANGRLLEYVAKSIDLQRQLVLNARVGGVPLVVVADRLVRMGEEDGVPVSASRLHGADGEVLLGDGVGHAGALDLFRHGALYGIVGVDLLAQHRALEGAAGFSLFLYGESAREHRVRQQQGSGFGVGEAGLAEVFAFVRGVQQAGEVVGDVVAAEVDARVEPGFGVHRRYVRRGGDVVCRDIAAGERRELLGVPLLDHAEAAELALLAVEVAVVVGVAGDEAIAADVVNGLDVLNHVHRERQPGDPRCTVALVLQVELGRGGVIDARLGAQVVDSLDQQMRLAAAHQVDVAHRPPRARQGRGPHQAGRAVAEQIGGHDARRSSMRGNTFSVRGWLQLLPDWLKYRRTPSRWR